MWSVWDKKTDINNCSAEYIFTTFSHLVREETIFLKTINGRVTQVEGKGTLAAVYGIDPTLTNDEFIAEYERILTEPEPAEEPMAAEVDEPTEGG